MENTIEKLKEIAKFRKKEPEEIIAKALEIGLQKMWVDEVLTQYLEKRISRRKTMRLVGIDFVRLAEYQDKMAQADVLWGADETSNR